jgi:Uri superfamily endonuclease
VEKKIMLNVGSLGRIEFKSGLYAYVGSAQSNLEQRIKRHLTKEKRLFWHIDYLLNSDAVRILSVLVKEARKTEECVIADTLGKKGKLVKNFGSSDCHCRSHLVHMRNGSLFLDSMREFYKKQWVIED